MPLVGLQCVIMAFPGHIHLLIIKYFNCTNKSGVSLIANLKNNIMHRRFYVLLYSRKTISFFLLFHAICFKIYLDVFLYAENKHINGLFYTYLFGFSSLFHTF